MTILAYQILKSNDVCTNLSIGTERRDPSDDLEKGGIDGNRCTVLTLQFVYVSRW
jgi:hypothetical protein